MFALRIMVKQTLTAARRIDAAVSAKSGED